MSTGMRMFLKAIWLLFLANDADSLLLLFAPQKVSSGFRTLSIKKPMWSFTSCRDKDSMSLTVMQYQNAHLNVELPTFAHTNVVQDELADVVIAAVISNSNLPDWTSHLGGSITTLASSNSLPHMTTFFDFISPEALIPSFLMVAAIGMTLLMPKSSSSSSSVDSMEGYYEPATTTNQDSRIPKIGVDLFTNDTTHPATMSDQLEVEELAASNDNSEPTVRIEEASTVEEKTMVSVQSTTKPVANVATTHHSSTSSEVVMEEEASEKTGFVEVIIPQSGSQPSSTQDPAVAITLPIPARTQSVIWNTLSWLGDGLAGITAYYRKRRKRTTQAQFRAEDWNFQKTESLILKALTESQNIFQGLTKKSSKKSSS